MERKYPAAGMLLLALALVLWPGLAMDAVRLVGWPGSAYAATYKNPLTKAKEAYEAGVRYHLKKRYEDAIAEYLKAASLEPDHPVIFDQLGHVYYSLYEADEAAKMFEKAARLDYSYPDPHFMLGKIYKEQKKYERALDEIAIFLRLAPESSDKWEAEAIREECERLLMEK